MKVPANLGEGVADGTMYRSVSNGWVDRADVPDHLAADQHRGYYPPVEYWDAARPRRRRQAMPTMTHGRVYAFITAAASAAASHVRPSARGQRLLLLILFPSPTMQPRQ